MTEGDELAMQAQWIDLIAFDLLMGKLDAAKEIKEARYGSGDVSLPIDQPT